MDNKIFLEQMKIYYDSLKFFEISENILTLHAEKEFKMPLYHTYLSTLPPNIFLLYPTEIFQIVYMLELLHKESLKDTELNFIKNYTEKYLKLSDEAKENNNIDQNRLWCLEIPINKAYDEEISNSMYSESIINLIDNHTNDMNSGLGKTPRLVLIKENNPNFMIDEEIDNVKAFKDAGFTTIFLITSTIVATCLYLAFFVFS